MKLYVDSAGKQFTVSRDPEPKTEQGGKQRSERDTGRLMWVTQVFVLDETGGEVILVTTAGEKPGVRQGELVTPVQLEAIPWSMVDNGKHRHGVSFRATEIRQNKVGAK